MYYTYVVPNWYGMFLQNTNSPKVEIAILSDFFHFSVLHLLLLKK